MNNVMFWLQPFIAAFTGWFTTWIAIFMLFHPKNPKRFLGITIQGVFPKRQKQFAMKLGKVVATELINFKDIAEQLKDPRHLSNVKPIIEKHLDDFLKVKLKEKLPVIAMFVSDGMLGQIKEGMLEEIEQLLPDVLSHYTDSMTNKIDIEQMVTDKVADFSSDKLEEILKLVMSKEFRFVELIGGVLGFVIGVIQLALSFI